MTNSIAQQNSKTIAGAYLLTGVMETASAFDLKPDSTFDFFFSQGALDRGGNGTWTIKDGHLILNSSAKRPAKDYALVTSKTIPGNSSTIKMVDKNTMILSYSDVTLVTPAGRLEKSTNSEGEVQFNNTQASSISLLFRLCPDRSSVFTVDPKHNYFEFRLEPWIAEVFFDNFSLEIKSGTLVGANPVMGGKQFTYKKED